MEEAARLFSHPAFGAALVRLGANLLAISEANRSCARAIGQHRRYGVAALILYFDDRFRSGLGPAPTRATLTKLAERAGLGTRRGIGAILDVLLHFGFVCEAALTDARSRRLVPATPLTDYLAAGLAARLDAAALLGPLPSAATHPERVLAVYLGQLVEPLLEENRMPRQAFPELAPFADRVAGYMLLFHVLALSEQAPPGAPVAIRVADLARQLHVSRMQVAKILAAAARAGLWTTHSGPAICWNGEVHQRLRLFAAVELARATCAARTHDLAMQA
ncbi:hypothetical protein P6144_16505 [Sphingomonas sp. HITSZ_GF]|uniref:hypothetical protein n=1 Tax=Sphingomonas sp. HITSZ_GF TaxID=3037247 RepID=UPI00240DB625|nr:hypothetical protein [Sphingomonas sp. HITSZ_GF]MDG2535264.1 hypothetical protein [Sphingomonas sp. HITSZ_GF]